MINKVIEYITSLTDEIYYSEMFNIEKAALLINEQLNNKGRLLFFGQGHSVWVGEDAKGAYDLPIVSLKQQENIDDMISMINKEDVLIITSNSGTNEYVVETARRVKENGNKIIAITSYKHTFNSKSKHPLKKKLFQYADITIDNACEYGDAAIKDEDYYFGSYSSIANSAIVHSILRLCKN